MRRFVLCLLPLTVAAVAVLSRTPAEGACCYFSALGQDVRQPAQKAFLTWHPQEGVETFTVQPKFEGNAKDFGMVIPTPSRPRLFEMPREFFNELAVFTLLKPVPAEKFGRQGLGMGGFGGGMGGGLGNFGGGGGGALPPPVVVLESGLVGSLDYKIVAASQAADLYQWLKDNHYRYEGDTASLDVYLRRNWVFTVMKIDPMQQKQNGDGTFSGSISPTRFVFSTSRLIYPLQITRRSIKDSTEALFYVQAPYKVDLPGASSYQLTWAPMWRQGMALALPGKLTARERAWQPVVKDMAEDLQRTQEETAKRLPGWQPARLDWAKRLNDRDIGILEGTVRFDRTADRKAVQQLSLLRGHLRRGQWLTKIRKVFRPAEMSEDLEFAPATLGGQTDEMEYTFAYPTSPP